MNVYVSQNGTDTFLRQVRRTARRRFRCRASRRGRRSAQSGDVDGARTYSRTNVVLSGTYRVSAPVSRVSAAARPLLQLCGAATFTAGAALRADWLLRSGRCALRTVIRRTAACRAHSEPHEDSPGLAQKRIPESHRSGRRIGWSAAESTPTRSPSSGRCAPSPAGSIYATGTSRIGGWFLGLTALFDVLDGTVARRSNKSSTFGAFLDSTLDRVADGAVLGGLAVFYALNPSAPQRADGGGLSRSD